MYPVDGTPLVPEVLRPFVGAVSVDRRALKRAQLPAGTTFGDIGAAELAKLDDGCIRELVDQTYQALRQTMSRIEASNTVVGLHNVPEALARERLSGRGFNVAMRAQLLQLPWITETSLGDMAREEGMGAASLLEILSLIQSTGGVPPDVAPDSTDSTAPRSPSKAVREAAMKLVRRRWSTKVTRADPRLHALVADLGLEGDTAKQIAESLAEAEYTPGEARGTVNRIGKLLDAADALKKLTVEQEIDQLIDASVRPSAAGRAALRSRLGLTAGTATTLAAAGDAAGMTRERVRQIERDFVEMVGEASAWTPALDRAIEEVIRKLPGYQDEIEQSLVEAGITQRLSLEALLDLAALLGAPEVDASLDSTGLAFRGDLPLREIASIARRLVTHWGATTIEELKATLHAEAGTAIDSRAAQVAIEASGFEWLDTEHSWFWIRGLTRNRLLNQIEKIMSVAGSIPIGELRAGVGRHHRMKGFCPPREVLARLCVASGNYRREGDLIIETGLPPWEEVLSPNERVLAEILFEFGPVMRREELERIACDERGMNRSSFYIYLSYLPFLQRFAAGVYGLRGAQIGAAEVQSLIPLRARSQRLRDHGWTKDRDIWIVYELSATVAHSGVLSVASELRDLAKGKFALLTEDDRPIGTLVMKGNAMWGLSPFFRRSGVEEGDYILITIDLTSKTATIAAGTDELLLRYQAGE